MMTRKDWADRSTVSAMADVAQWMRAAATCRAVLRPVVSFYSARCIGLEARFELAEGRSGVGFGDIGALYDAACGDGVLPEVEAALIERAFQAFQVVMESGWKLFLNLDARALEASPRLLERLEQVRRRYGLAETALTIEVFLTRPLEGNSATRTGLRTMTRASIHLALEQFGEGRGDLSLLHELKPDYIKISPTFFGDTNRDNRKIVLMRHMVSMAHLLGIQVVADGVSSEKEFMVCKDVGCDLLQGPLLSGPENGPGGILYDYPVVARLNAQDRRIARSDQSLVLAEVSDIPPLAITSRIVDAFDRFRKDQSLTSLPVVNSQNEPLGVLRDHDLKSFAYSPYGRDLLTNRSYGHSIAEMLWNCPVADIAMKAEQILEIFSADETSEGIIITRDGRYHGFLSARSLLRILNEKNLNLARDQNPLTKLPGNTMINDYLAEALADESAPYVIAYIDFDNFKPFNDAYGFRQGDRAITLFADILRKDLPQERCFVGHVGGDDFFAAFRTLSFEEARQHVCHVIERFRSEVESFYDEETRARGFIVAKDRSGVMRQMSLLTASAALIHIPAGHAPGSLDEVSAAIATLKKQAKNSPERLAAITLAPGKLIPA